ncbi:hypothetical protein ACFQFH_04650 [Halobaculum halobium]|uniref:DUF7310 domain-containing protein n=1 Tax=Halobaculum halobium TaxID=3032281 RepID=A0ABD5T7A6_9EURY|nr:hypothetical protein [Halobaculum sp. SYNS20]
MSREEPTRFPPETEQQTPAGCDCGSPAAAVDDLRTRLAAVERACSGDAKADLTDIADATEATAELRRAADRLDDIEDRVGELEAATQALRGYVGSIRAVNERVEHRADRALAAARAAPTRDRSAAPAAAVDQAHLAPSPDLNTPLESDSENATHDTAERGGVDGTDDDATALVERLRDAL